MRSIQYWSSLYSTWIATVQERKSLLERKNCTLRFNLEIKEEFRFQMKRTKRDGIEEAIETFQRAAGAFNYIRLNFSNAPTADMSASFLNGIVNLMLAQVPDHISIVDSKEVYRHKRAFSKRKCLADCTKQQSKNSSPHRLKLPKFRKSTSSLQA